MEVRDGGEEGVERKMERMEEAEREEEEEERKREREKERRGREAESRLQYIQLKHAECIVSYALPSDTAQSQGGSLSAHSPGCLGWPFTVQYQLCVSFAFPIPEIDQPDSRHYWQKRFGPGPLFRAWLHSANAIGQTLRSHPRVIRLPRPPIGGTVHRPTPRCGTLIGPHLQSASVSQDELINDRSIQTRLGFSQPKIYLDII
jgi:hypothetical protein